MCLSFKQAQGELRECLKCYTCTPNAGVDVKVEQLLNLGGASDRTNNIF